MRPTEPAMMNRQPRIVTDMGRFMALRYQKAAVREPNRSEKWGGCAWRLKRGSR